MPQQLKSATASSLLANIFQTKSTSWDGRVLDATCMMLVVLFEGFDACITVVVIDLY